MRSLILVLALVAGCGARSGLEPLDLPAPVTDAGLVSDASTADAGTDAGSDAGPPDTGVCEEPLLVVTSGNGSTCPPGHAHNPFFVLGGPGLVTIADLENRSDRTMRVTRWHFSEFHPDDRGCSLRTFARMNFWNGETGEIYGDASFERRDRDNNDVTFLPSGLLLPPGRTRVYATADLASYASGACVGWASAFTFTVGVGLPRGDMDVVWEDGSPLPERCVGPAPMTHSTGFAVVTRADLRIRNGWLSTTVPIGGERQVGQFQLFNDFSLERYETRLEAVTLIVSGLSRYEGRTLRLYADVIDPEHLLGSAIIGPGAPAMVEFRDEDLIDMDVSDLDRERPLLVTVETDGLFTAATMRVDIRNAQWSDGVGRYGDVDCEPILGATVTFVRAP